MQIRRQILFLLIAGLMFWASFGLSFPETAVYANFSFTSTPTPVPPTDTPVSPTDTPVPPTDTPDSPTETPAPPTNTPVPPTRTRSGGNNNPTNTPQPVVGTPDPASTPSPDVTSVPGAIPEAIPPLGAGPQVSTLVSLGLSILGAVLLLFVGWRTVLQRIRE